MRTLRQTTRYEEEVRRSRFIAHAGRVDDPAHCPAFREAVADPQATHNCWAWRIGDRYRFHDDGEPGGTAGRPILAAIEGKGLDHVMVVVTRHYGGIKLGAGGLTRAYSSAAARCLDRAPAITVEPRLRCRVEAGFEWTGPVYAALDSCGAERLQEQHRPEGVALLVSVPESAFKSLQRALRDATRGAAALRKLG